MKKVWIVLGIAAVIGVGAFVIMSVSDKPTTLPLTDKDYDNPARIVNPITEYTSIDEINDVVGCSMKTYPNSSSEKFSVISANIAQYVIDDKYTFRASQTSDDISGVYVSGGTISQVANEDEIYAQDETTYYVYWFVGEMQYSLYGQDTDLDSFTEVYNALR